MGKRNFESLCNDLIHQNSDKLPKNAKDALDHGKFYKSKAKDLYIDVLRMKLLHVADV